MVASFNHKEWHSDIVILVLELDKELTKNFDAVPCIGLQTGIGGLKWSLLGMPVVSILGYN